MKSIVTALVDPSGAADYGPDAYVEIWSALPVGAGGTIATDKPLRVPVTSSGLSTPPIRAGNYLIRLKLAASRTALGPYPFTMPDGDGTTELWPLIAAGVNIPGDTPIQKIQEALAAYLVANPIDGNGLDQSAVDTRVQTVGDTRYAPLSEVDVRQFYTGAIPSDATTAMLAAHAAANTLAVSSGRPVQVVYPAGIFHFYSNIPVYNRVGIKGASIGATKFVAHGEATLQYGNLIEAGQPNANGDVWMEDNLYEDFWLDCSQQSYASYTAAIKGMWVSNMRRPLWRRVRMSDTWATNLGVDYIVDGLVDSCIMEGGGRGRGAAVKDSGTGANIGIGVGRYRDEKLVVRNTVMRNSLNNNVYLERLEQRGSNAQYPNCIILDGCTIDGSPIGISDCGSGGIVVKDTTIRYRNYGIAVRAGGGSSLAGRDGTLERVTFEDLANPVVAGDTRVAVMFATGPSGGGYRIIDPLFVGVPANAIHVYSGADLRDGGLSLDLRRKQDVGNSILRVDRTTPGALSKLYVDGTVEGWAKVTGAPPIDVAADVRDMRLPLAYRGAGQFSKANTGPRIDAACVFTMQPRLRDARFVDMLGALTDPASKVLLTDPQQYPPKPRIYDTFTRSNVLEPGVTEGGTQAPTAWEILPAGSIWRIENGGLRLSSGSTGECVVETGISDVLVTGTIAAKTTSPTDGGAIARLVDHQNFLQLNPWGSTGYALSKLVGNVRTVLQQTTVVGAVGDVVEIKCVGSTITGYVNGVLITTPHTVTDMQTATKHGWRSQTTFTTAGDFAVTAAA